MVDSSWVTGHFEGEFVGRAVRGRRPNGQRSYALTLTLGTIRQARRVPALPLQSVDDPRKWLVQAELADAVFLTTGPDGTDLPLGRCRLHDVHLGQWTVAESTEGRGFCSGRISGTLYAQALPAPVTVVPIPGPEAGEAEEEPEEAGGEGDWDGDDAADPDPGVRTGHGMGAWLPGLLGIVGLLSLAWLLFRILGSPFLLFWLGLLLMALALRAWLGGSLLARKLGCLPLALGVLFAAYLLIRIGAFALLFSSGCLGFALAAALLWAFYRVVRAAGLAAFGLFAVGLACAGLLWHRSPPPPPATFTQGAAPGYAPPQPAYLPQALVGVVPLDKAMEDPGAFFDHPGQRLLLDNELLFPFESAQLSSEAMGSLHKLARLLRSHPTARVVLEGHTDTIGTAEANQQLSALRAEAVKDCLVGRFHLDPGQLSIRGAGSANPLIAAGDAQAQSRNRRVEVRVAEPEPKPVPEAEPEPEPETE